jgi:hypothetical protein
VQQTVLKTLFCLASLLLLLAKGGKEKFVAKEARPLF